MSEVEPYIVDHEDPRLNQDNPSAESSTDAVVQSSAVTRRTARIAAGVSAIEELFPTIRLSQFNALTKFRDFISSGQTRGHFRMPTGAGKTVLFGLIVKLLKEKTLILVPNINLLTATRNELVDTLGMSAEEIGLVGGGSNENGKNITVMTYQSFLTRGAPEGVTTVIFDEVHRSLGAQTREAVDQVLDGGIEVEEEITEGEEAAEIEALERLESMDILSIGFTATTQLSTKNVTEIHGPEIDNVSYSDLISAGILKSVEVHPVTAEMDSEEEKGQMTKEKEDRILMASKIYDSTLIEFRTFFDSFTEHPIRTIAFCHSLAACDLFQEKAREAGFRTTIVTGHQGDLQSAEQQMLDGEIDIIITVDKLKEGWNFRPLNTVLWLRSTGSPGPLIQGAGRAMRAYLLEKVMHLFEAEWRLSYRPTKGPPKGEKGAPTGEGTSNRPRISRKAMTFAQALLAMGESLRGVLANDVLPHHIIYIDLDEFGLGTSEKYGEVCGLNAYAPSLDMSPHAFKGVVAAAKINPCEGILGRRPPHTAIDLYSKSDIDKVFEGIVRFGEHKYKEVDGHGLCGGLFAYSRSVRLAVSTVEKLVEEKKVEPIKNFVGLSHSNYFTLYRKEDLDRIYNESIYSNAIELENGRKDTEELGVVIGLASFANAKGLSYGVAKSLVQRLNVIAIKGRAGKNISQYIDIYLLTDLERMMNSIDQLSDEGWGDSALGHEVCALNSYADHRKKTNSLVNHSTIKNHLRKASITPIPGRLGKYKKKYVEIYDKRLVDQIIEDAFSFTSHELDANGCVDIPGIGMACLVCPEYAADAPVSTATINRRITHHNIQPIPGHRAKRGRVYVPFLYLKSTIDALWK